ncbi:conserved Plasmodium protein, unknown function [Plasmodium ovale]|uniref:Uncharacterized protein n=2 Tax=Plasmodium ovale TaxID=36330 RepID=A0A1A8WZ39_PLAOA|nr:conserved Plasmodium protein, unknown function [Plasmodium ovale curtisi]SBS97162.1 conserved Plasmodium protein, unknown function [Plasmodium ovale curtisi]SCP05832.1 conserved Plasmodium protein, unknown function [Plasmodium ovale]
MALRNSSFLKMFRKLNGISLIGKMNKNHPKANFTCTQLVNKNMDITNKSILRTFIMNELVESGNKSIDKKTCFLPFSSNFISYEKVLNMDVNNISNIGGGYNTQTCTPKSVESPNESTFSTDAMRSKNITTNILNKRSNKILLFSWLKNIRKKQYYNIIGKLGIKKRNAGMYWNFYVNKRKKIRKKRKTI